jgi:hypothetical protein
MWHLRQPAASLIRDFLDHQKREPLSYREVGFSLSETPTGYDLDHNRIILGRGRAVFEAACEALKRWAMFPGPWTRIEPAGTQIQEGNVVAMLAHVFGLWWLNACRIVYLLQKMWTKVSATFFYVLHRQPDLLLTEVSSSGHQLHTRYVEVATPDGLPAHWRPKVESSSRQAIWVS